MRKSVRSIEVWSTLVLSAAFVSGLASGADKPRQPLAAERLNAVDTQTQALADRTGTWEVVAKFQPSADAKPVTTTGLVAERRMMGRYLSEVMRPAAGTNTPDFERIAYLTFSAVEGRWQYVSLDTRFPVGIMPAYSFDQGAPGKVTLEFAPIAFVGMGADVEGRMLRSNLVVTHDGKDHDVVQQFWVSSDGSGRRWLGVEYDYRRRQ